MANTKRKHTGSELLAEYGDILKRFGRYVDQAEGNPEGTYQKIAMETASRMQRRVFEMPPASGNNDERGIS